MEEKSETKVEERISAKAEKGCLQKAKKRVCGAQQTKETMVFKVVDHLATLGFSDPAG